MPMITMHVACQLKGNRMTPNIFIIIWLNPRNNGYALGI